MFSFILQDISRKIDKYIEDSGKQFTTKWFKKIMDPRKDDDPNKWDRAQIIGLGAVLITTVTFTAAFTIPGGYNQDDGTPIFGKKYVFKAFTIANTLSFLQSFASLFTIISTALADPDSVDLVYATDTFIAAAGCMVVAFGLGSYVILVPVSKGIAILVLVWVLPMGSPFMAIFLKSYKKFHEIFVISFNSKDFRAFQNLASAVFAIFVLALIPNN
jgi:Domain of unknown function